MEAPITPLPTPADVRAVLLVGGVFDPPHVGHTRSAVEARARALGEDAWIVFVPVARSPFKPLGPIASCAQRVEMMRLAAAEIPRSGVWTDEIDRAAWEAEHNAGPGFSYWIDTVRRARRALGEGVALRFVIGCDQAKSFDAWREPRGILEIAQPIVMLRQAGDTAERLRERLAADEFWNEEELDRWRTWAVASGAPGVNSTRIRGMIRAGESRDILAEQVAAPVLEYIQREKLYS